MLPSSPALPSRLVFSLEWVVLIGLIASFVGTTLALGGALPQAMVWTSAGVFGVGALGALLWASGHRGEPTPGFHGASLLPVPFLVYALINVLNWSPASWLAWTEWLLWFQAWLVFVLVLHFGHSRRQVGTLIGMLALLGLAGVILAAYQRLSDPDWLLWGRVQGRYFIGRSAGMFGAPNSLAALLELWLPVCLVLLFSRAVAPAKKVVCAWLAGLFLITIMLTGSRGAWISLAFTFVLCPWLLARRWKRKAMSALAITLLVGGCAWVTYQASEPVRQRLQPLLKGDGEITRPSMWSAAVDLWRTSPWWGTGAGSYGVLLDQHRPRGFVDAPKWAHNDYLNTLSDHGVVGFVLWFGAGLAIAGAGWRAIRRARRETNSATPIYRLAKWKLGLWLGLLAFSMHLFVDFHTKVPALLFAAAISAALLLRDDRAWWVALPQGVIWGASALLATMLLAVGWQVARPLYRAEALRFRAREWIDRFAITREGDPGRIFSLARRDLSRAVRIDPAHGQAWSDLAYATLLHAWATKDNVAGLGRMGELAADEALRCCDVIPEFWTRKGVALSLQQEVARADACFRQAVKLAPNSPAGWYQYAFHLAGMPARKPEALQALATCLALDPYYPDGELLRERLLNDR